MRREGGREHEEVGKTRREFVTTEARSSRFPEKATGRSLFPCRRGGVINEDFFSIKQTKTVINAKVN